MDSIHIFTMPDSLGGHEFGIRELDMESYTDAQTQAARRIKADDVDMVGYMIAKQKAETDRLMRIKCIASWDGRPVATTEGGVMGVIDELNVRQVQLVDRAINSIHSLTNEELESFDLSHRRPGAMAVSPRLQPASVPR